MSIYARTATLGSIDLNEEVVVGVYGDSGDGTAINVDQILTNNSTNPVTSRGIWDKLASLSGEIKDRAFEADEHSTNVVQDENT